MRSGTLQVVGQGMKRHEAGHVSDEAPSRPLSRASRAESIGSLADFSQHASLLPSDMEYSHRYRHPYDNLNTRAPAHRGGGGGVFLRSKSPASWCQPVSPSPTMKYSNHPQGFPGKVGIISFIIMSKL